MLHFPAMGYERYLCKFWSPHVTHRGAITFDVNVTGMHHHVSLYSCTYNVVPSHTVFDCTHPVVPKCREMIFTFSKGTASIPNDVSFVAPRVVLVQLHSLNMPVSISINMLHASSFAFPVRFVEIGPRIFRRRTSIISGGCDNTCFQNNTIRARYALLHMHHYGVSACVRIATRQWCVEPNGTNVFIPFEENITTNIEVRCTYQHSVIVPGMLHSEEMCFLHLLASSSVIHCWKDKIEYNCLK